MGYACDIFGNTHAFTNKAVSQILSICRLTSKNKYNCKPLSFFMEDSEAKEIMPYLEVDEGFWRLVAHLLIRYELDDLCFEDTGKALHLLGEELKNPKYPIAKNVALINDFEDDYNYIIAKIEYIDEKDETQMLMFLVYMVRTLESVVNEHLYFELEYKKFTKNEIKPILLKFSIDEKVGWFLKILCGKDYTKENSKNWSILKNFIITRNFYIHYKPARLEEFDNHIMKLSKESFKSFMGCVADINSFLSECKCKERTDVDERVNRLTNRIINRQYALMNEHEDLKNQLNDLRNVQN